MPYGCKKASTFLECTYSKKSEIKKSVFALITHIKSLQLKKQLPSLRWTLKRNKMT